MDEEDGIYSTLQFVSIWRLFEYIDHFSTTKFNMFCCKGSFLRACYFVDFRFSLQYSLDGHNMDRRLRFPQSSRHVPLWLVHDSHSEKPMHIERHWWWLVLHLSSHTLCGEDMRRVAAKQMMTSREDAFFIWNEEHILIKKAKKILRCKWSSSAPSNQLWFSLVLISIRPPLIDPLHKRRRYLNNNIYLIIGN